MDKHHFLTDEELAMLRDLGNDEDIATSQYLRGTLPLPLQSLLQRANTSDTPKPASPATTAFPAPLHPGRGGPRRSCASPRRPLQGAGFAPSARLATRRKGRALHRRRGVRGIQPLPWRSLSWPACRTLCQGRSTWRIPSHRGSPSLAMTGTSSGTWMPINITMTGPSSSGWAREDQEHCGTGSSSAHQDAFVQAYQGD